MRLAELLHVVGRMWNVTTPLPATRRRQLPQRRNGLEPLEIRALLSVVVAANGKSATYTDVDGDIVTVSVSTGTLTGANFTTVASGLGDQLQEINFTTGGFDDTNLTLKVKKAATGDGFANVGYIASVTHDLGSVTVPGDLGRINAGDATLGTPGITALKVRSMGRLGTDTQAAIGSLDSNINTLTSLSVTTDIINAFLNVSGTLASGITVGGSLIGGAAANSGEIQVDGNVGNVKITGNILGGAGAGSGTIQSINGKLGTVSVSGSVIGGAGATSGLVSCLGDMGAVNISGDLVGGSGNASGQVTTGGKLASATIGGSVLGGSGFDTGRVFSTANMGAVKITGDIIGGSNLDSGSINGGADITSITVGGSVIGADGDSSAKLSCTGNMGAVKITGSLIGAAGIDSGVIDPTGNLTSLSIGGDLIGGAGDSSGQIDPAGTAGAITINGSMLGGAGDDSGEIDPGGTCGNVKIGLDLRGGSGDRSGAIDPVGNLSGVTIGGSLIGGSGNNSGVIMPTGTLGAVSIGGDMVGGSLNASSSLDSTGAIIATSTIKSVSITGSLIAGHNGSSGTLTKSGVILCGNDIQSVTIKGSIIGNPGNNVIIAARGQIAPSATVDVALGTLSVSGHVEFAQILGGYDTTLTAANGRAQINTIKITGDLIASSIVAGATAGPDSVFGTVDDVSVAGGSPVSAINSITIGGVVLGTSTDVSAADHFGFVARRVKSVKIGSLTLAVTNADDTDIIQLSPSTGDFTLRED